jgi:hypothetical protein
VKLTVEIPAALMRKARAMAASRAKSVEAVVLEALHHALVSNGSVATQPSSVVAGTKGRRSPKAVKWVQQWEQLVNAVAQARKSDRTAREILRQTRR